MSSGYSYHTSELTKKKILNKGVPNELEKDSDRPPPYSQLALPALDHNLAGQQYDYGGNPALATGIREKDMNETLTMANATLPTDLSIANANEDTWDDDSEDESIQYAEIESLKSHAELGNFVNDISTNLLLKSSCSWGEMLSAAPRALCSIGQCFVAATSSGDVASLMLPPDPRFS
jgi:hypothetical protein